MRKIMTLVNIEVNRIFKFLVGILGLYTIVQTIFILLSIDSEKENLIRQAKNNSLSVEELLNTQYCLNPIETIMRDNAVIMAFAIAFILIFIYGLIIWYREWFGNNKVIYTLMILPMERFKVYISKFIVMILLIVSLLSTFIITQIINYQIIINMIPQYKNSAGNFERHFNRYIFTELFIPTNLIEFIIYFSLIFSAIALIFLFVHLEISYKFKGAVLGIVLGVAYLVLLYLLYRNSNILIREKMLLIILYNIITICSAVTCSKFLLNKKLKV